MILIFTQATQLFLYSQHNNTAVTMSIAVYGYFVTFANRVEVLIIIYSFGFWQIDTTVVLPLCIKFFYNLFALLRTGYKFVILTDYICLPELSLLIILPLVYSVNK